MKNFFNKPIKPTALGWVIITGTALFIVCFMLLLQYLNLQKEEMWEFVSADVLEDARKLDGVWFLIFRDGRRMLGLEANDEIIIIGETYILFRHKETGQHRIYLTGDKYIEKYLKKNKKQRR